MAPPSLHSSSSGITVGNSSQFSEVQKPPISFGINPSGKSGNCLRGAMLRCLVLLFLNLTFWMAISCLLQLLEGRHETSYKCGVKRVRRDFIDSLWNETSSLREADWKSSARRHLVQFEEQLHSAVEAGVSSYSGQRVWTFANAMMFSFSTTSTIGYGSLVPSSFAGRLLTCLSVLLGTPLFLLMVSEASFVLLWGLGRAVTLANDRLEKTRENEPKGWIAKALERLCRERTGDALNADFSTAVFYLLLLIAYALCGGILFSMVFLWSPSSSAYFALTSAASVGFGDVVPEDSVLFFCLGFWYILIGLALFLLYNNVAQAQILLFLERKMYRDLPDKEKSS